MASKTYTVRVPEGAPEITSEDVTTMLDKQLSSNAALAGDPGAGERMLRLSLDQDKVKSCAQAAGEPDAVFLRRLIASNVSIPGKEKEEQEARPKAPVLRGAMKFRPDQVRPLVRALEAGQALVIRKTLRLPLGAETVEATAFTEEERDRLSTVGVEVINRRAPEWVVENGDIFALLTEIAAIETKKIEAALVLAAQFRKFQAQQGAAEQPAPE